MPLPHPLPDDDLKWAEPVLRREVRIFVRRSGVFRLDDEEDLIQVCLAHWWQRRDRFDPTRSSRQTFLKRVTLNMLLSLARSERSGRRLLGRSLDEKVGDRGRTLGDFIASPIEEVATTAERSELVSRVRAVYPTLQAVDQRIFDGLGRGVPKSVLADELGIGRTAVVRSIERIRKIFRADGLEIFLD